MNFTEEMKKNKPYIYHYKDISPDLKSKAKNLLWEFNNLRPDNEKRKQDIIKELLGTSTPLTFIESTFKCDYGFNIHFSGMAFVNYNCVMLDTSPIYIGNGVFIGPGTCISCAGHAIDATQRSEGFGDSKPINIEDNVWLGANCTILGGITIGEGSIIGAGSVVTKDIPKGVIAVGNPCKVLREVTDADKWDLNNLNK
ncbi:MULTISPECIES: sugar O-acetyltransferase [unclassified Romboutsia]|uniref:sugar O-acetyltransferase n=1 Tax=unclassified Romboutsia TaxID=2626894 RepID=UPI0008226718|nr:MULTISPECIES: sugar O-acetyltransferase [unclassified Romboutsia]SCI40866.1 Putative acetyltransferase SACOL2570 [uncultured Clostridium sp.]